MESNAFTILGIEPTNDAHTIRSAYVRLARIYHPDRFVGMPDDVRAEAERRMKEATAAYKSLRDLRRNSKQLADQAPGLRDDMWERAKRARDTVDTIRLDQEISRTRWLLWEELERQARDRAEWEARMAAQLIERPPRSGSQPAPEADGSAPAAASLLSQRLAAARDDTKNALSSRRNDSA